MNDLLQTLLAFGLVAFAAGWLCWRALSRPGSGCGGGCACPSRRAKKRLSGARR